MRLATLIAKSIREPRRAARIAAYRLLAPVGHLNYRKFVVLTRDRTGSTMLMQVLNSHPNIVADLEIFANLKGRSEKSILDRCFGRQPFYIKARGFKIFYYHPQDAAGSPIWDMLAGMDGLHVIHLKRRNILHTAVSSKIAYATRIYGVRSESQEASYKEKLKAINITVDQLDHEFSRTRKWEKEGAEKFAGHPMIDVFYEDVAANRDAEFERITSFLGLPYRKPATSLRKQRTDSMRDLVSNYDALKAHFSTTEWADFFDD